MFTLDYEWELMEETQFSTNWDEKTYHYLFKQLNTKYHYWEFTEISILAVEDIPTRKNYFKEIWEEQHWLTSDQNEAKIMQYFELMNLHQKMTVQFARDLSPPTVNS